MSNLETNGVGSPAIFQPLPKPMSPEDAEKYRAAGENKREEQAKQYGLVGGDRWDQSASMAAHLAYTCGIPLAGAQRLIAILAGLERRLEALESHIDCGEVK
ncbi:MAG: hypothetical protein LAN64_14240 [Acidobacteriia bacterium]|nr:hypothetical protein [Terriglobia bacterium]